MIFWVKMVADRYEGSCEEKRKRLKWVLENSEV